MGKVIMKSDKTLENINKLKSIIDSLNENISTSKDSTEISQIKDRLSFMQKMLKDNEEMYKKFLINDSPYYEDSSFDNFKEKFTGLSFSDLQHSFAREVVNCVESSRIKNKLGAIKNMVKAYNQRDEEIYAEYRKRFQ